MTTKHLLVLGDSRFMPEIKDSSIQLVVTSPPYPMIEMWDTLFKRMDPRIRAIWTGKTDGGHHLDPHMTLSVYRMMHENLAFVWKECYRVLCYGGLICINIGDATRSIGGNFRLFSNHSRTIEILEEIGFQTLPYIVWKKPTNKPNAFLGSGFLPTNAYVTLDLEHILIFRKGGPRKFAPRDKKRYASMFSKADRDVWFSQVWQIRGAPQASDVIGRRTASFPEEIPRRLIRMFSVKGDTVLDPFLGTGTTMKVAAELGRRCIGYEIDERLKPTILKRIGAFDQVHPYSDYRVVERFKAIR
jgi:DNA modification methylase